CRGRPADARRACRVGRIGLLGPGRGGEEGAARRLGVGRRLGTLAAGRGNTSPEIVYPGVGHAGAHSPRLKVARRLTKRAFRQRERAFLAEGPQAVAAALSCGAKVSDLFVTVPAR